MYAPGMRNSAFDFFFVGKSELTSAVSLVFLRLIVESSATPTNRKGALQTVVKALRESSMEILDVRMVYVVPQKLLIKLSQLISSFPKSDGQIMTVVCPIDIDVFC